MIHLTPPMLALILSPWAATWLVFRAVPALAAALKPTPKRRKP